MVQILRRRHHLRTTPCERQLDDDPEARLAVLLATTGLTQVDLAKLLGNEWEE